MKRSQQDRIGESSVVNPQVNSANDQLAELIDGFLSPEKLKRVSGCEDLTHVTALVLKVDTRLTSISIIGTRFKLNNSYIPSIRDLGSGYSNLTVLWMARCSLTEVDGISSSLVNLKELYLANNEIFDISSIGMLDDLQVLDLEGNQIVDFEQIEQLALCNSLVELSLEGNPVSKMGAGDEASSNSESGDEESRRQFRFWLCVLDFFLTSTIGDSGSVIIPSKMIQPPRPVTSLGRLYFSSNLTFGNGDTMAGNPVLFLRSRRKRAESASGCKDANALSQLFSELRTSVTGINQMKDNKNDPSVSSQPPSYSSIKQSTELVSITKLTSATKPSYPQTVTMESIRTLEIPKIMAPIPPPTLPIAMKQGANVYRRRREFVRTLKPLNMSVASNYVISTENQ
ncbi:hypothetical protein BDR26DRAFT_858353 [Obelidium mucronatum]|nr:hypothetical protein BDR26DRAFT_858353 [Obelidium mucronatum]